MNLTLQRDISAPAERVWARITDLEQFADTITGIDTVERLDEGTGFGVGTRWRETRTLFGRSATEEMEVTDIEEGHSYRTEAESHGARYVSIMTVDPLTTDSSRLTMTFDAHPQGALAKVMAATVGRLFAGATRKALESDIEDIAAATEG